ncbi:hypothetical protein D9756_003763 [Leucocoprinus leucothites]|uniref:methylated diphthine methylhydrolase n=1 Tax=Leucocoprinus leucothites TaxID=201217 RepID=A0A8H5G0N0_9AGAR|nr:hypothetical protein D9756_003763 [Leucoagaricus leucothites]
MDKNIELIDMHSAAFPKRIGSNAHPLKRCVFRWIGPIASRPNGSLVVSLSNGFICLIRHAESSWMLAETWHAHDHEPWIAAWNYWDTSVIYSGGDDLKLKAWDIRCGFDSPIFVNKRFDAGVTSIQSNPHIEHLIAVGSYNNMVQLFDARKPIIPISQVNVGGGAWRVKWHPSNTRKSDLLVASMHDGFKVLTFDSDSLNASDSGLLVAEDGRIIKRFDEHASLAYGVDWSFAPSTEDTVIGSCSFYDHTLHLWKG